MLNSTTALCTLCFEKVKVKASCWMKTQSSPLIYLQQTQKRTMGESLLPLLTYKITLGKHSSDSWLIELIKICILYMFDNSKDG